MHKQLWSGVVGILGVGLLVPAWPVLSCPFCTASAQTIHEEMAAMAAVVIAQLEQPPKPTPQDSAAPNEAPPSATFTITHVLKGESAIGPRKSLTTVFYGDAKPGDKFLVMGIDPPDLAWSTPLPLNDRQHQYVLDLMKLPEDEVERLAFFQAYLEDTDELLSKDAYDEFARAPYATVKKLKPKMNRDQLVARIVDPDLSPSRKRLYLTMLGVCGNAEDANMLERRLRGKGSDPRPELDAMIACYLTLRGAEGVPLIEELFLQTKAGTTSDNYPDIYASIVALRFHATEGDRIPPARVLQAFSLVLDNPRMADLVIPDFARWQDWSQLERLVDMFKNADASANANAKNSYVRMPIINFVRACPLPAAKEALELFQEIDPEAVKRSMTFYPTIPKHAK